MAGRAPAVLLICGLKDRERFGTMRGHPSFSGCQIGCQAQADGSGAPINRYKLLGKEWSRRQESDLRPADYESAQGPKRAETA